MWIHFTYLSTVCIPKLFFYKSQDTIVDFRISVSLHHTYKADIEVTRNKIDTHLFRKFIWLLNSFFLPTLIIPTDFGCQEQGLSFLRAHGRTQWDFLFLLAFYFYFRTFHSSIFLNSPICDRIAAMGQRIPQITLTEIIDNEFI